ncbi:MAG: alpha/beta hydrolase [Deltaproteobacteria bacterium]|nr:alpha/beta hydrolase [Deltaproteobacteria bacterium]
MTRLTFDETSRHAKAGPISLHFNEAGPSDAETIVFLHGGGPGASSWSNFKQNLPSFIDDYRCLLVDMPGFGLSDKPEIPKQFFEFAADSLVALLSELGIGKAHLVGNSLGGGASLRTALDHPDRVDKLVLMGPGGAFKPVFTPEPAEGIKLLSQVVAPPGPTREKVEAFLRVMVYDQRFITEELIEERLEQAMNPENQAGLVRCMATFAPDRAGELWRELDRIPHPTLMIWGRDDRTLPLDGALLALQQLPDARLHVFPRCAHWAQVEHQAAFDRLVLDFLGNT